MHVRLARDDDRRRLEELAGLTFPLLSARMVVPVAALAEVHVGERDGRVVAGSVVTELPEEPTARRLQIVAEGGASWWAMYEESVERLRRSGVLRWYFVVREDSEFVLECLTLLGFRLSSRSWGAGISPGDSEIAALRAARDRVLTAAVAPTAAVLPAGTATPVPASTVPVVTLTRLSGADGGAAHALYERCRPDFPVTPATTPEAYDVAQMAALLADSFAFGLWVGEQLAALTVVTCPGNGTVADTLFTVTDARFRGRGFATAVKAQSVLELLSLGCLQFRTGGAQVNEPSLRANRRLGYVIEPLWLTFCSSP